MIRKVLRVALGAGLAGFLLAIPMQSANAWWGGPGWYNDYAYHPAYRFGPPEVRRYIRDLHRHGPAYADYWNRRWYW